MYFPYLRSKQEELLAIREATFLDDLTVPILEWVRRSDVNEKRVKQAIASGRRLAIIANGANGDPVPSFDEVEEFIHDLSPDAVFPALELRADTDINTIRGFVDSFVEHRCLVVHRSHQHSSQDLSRWLDPVGDAAGSRTSRRRRASEDRG